MLKPSERVFIQAFIDNGGNGVQAAKTAYPRLTYGSLRVKAHRLLTNANIHQEIVDVINNGSLSDEFLVRRLKQIIEKPEEKDGIALNGISLVGKWKGYDEPKSKFEIPKPPLPPDQIDAMLIRARAIVGTKNN